MTTQQFKIKYCVVATSQNLVPRNYQTVGGQWTAEVYKSNDWTARLEDEGYTKVLIDHKNKKQYVLDYADNVSEKDLK